jgi:hypothetical protein
MMKVGLIDVDSHNFPNLALMKISAWHKSRGDSVEWCIPVQHYDVVYTSKVFGDEYTQIDPTIVQADKIIYGGTGFAISIVDGKEVYTKTDDPELPYEIEHIYPDYSLYPEYTKDCAYGFLSRGCPNNCGFCLVSKKSGRVSHKVADLTEFWNGQKNIVLLDPNIMACREHMDLLKQLVDSGACVEFNQGIDARFIDESNVELLSQIKMKIIHFAFDFMKNEDRIICGLKLAKQHLKLNDRNSIVYMLTNYDTSIREDLYRVKMLKETGFSPDVRIYRKASLPKRHILRDLQRWCNNRILFRSTSFFDYVPRTDGVPIRELYKDILKDCEVI